MRLRLSPHRSRQVGLDLVILVEFGFDIVVNACNLLYANKPPCVYVAHASNLLQRVDEVGDGLVCPVLDVVPLEGFQVLFHGLYIYCQTS